MQSAITFQHSLVQDFYTNHNAWLYRWLVKKMGSPFDAADLAQETFVKLLSRNDVDSIAEPRAYLTTIAQRILANHYQRQSIEQTYLEALANLPQQTYFSAEEKLILLETLQQIDSMLNDLPCKVRTAFLLSQLDGKTYVEIAEQLQINVRTVKRYMVQAFEQCLLCLD